MTQTPEIEEIYPLSPMQEGMLFHALLAPESEEYFEQLQVRIQGELNVVLFRSSFDALMQAHAILRTAFNWEKRQEPFQIVYKTAVLPWMEEDWREASGDAQEARLDEYLRADRRRGFDLTKAPLFRLHVIRVGDDIWHVCWSHHHLLLDGWSRSLLLREWMDRYKVALRGGNAPQHRPLPYRQHLLWLSRQDAGAAEGFWRQELAGFETAPALALGPPAGADRNAPDGGDFEVRWDPQMSRELRDYASRHDLTLNSLTLGAWSLLLGRLAGSSEPACGVTVSGRPAGVPGVETMVGLFINTIPLRVRLDPAAPVAAWLAGVQGKLARLREFEFSPLASIQSWSGAPPGTPLFDSIFVFENYPANPTNAGEGLPFQITAMKAFERTNYPLTVVISPGEETSLRILFNPGLFSPGQIERLAIAYGNLLRQITTAGDRPLGDLVCAAPEELRMFERWNDTGRSARTGALLHGYFNEQALRTPDADALVAGHGRLTYSELGARAARLAAALRMLGARPEQLVGLCLERGMDLIAGMLGILESGAAYVPLDPRYPPDRLGQMLRDSGAGIVVCHDSLRSLLPEEYRKGGQVDDLLILRLPGGSGASRPACLEPVSANVAYLIYTSGSTGVPKGTAIEHRSAAALVDWALGVFSPQELKGVLFSTSVCFDLSIFELFVTWASGGAVLLAENALELESLPARLEVTLINTVPSAIAELLRLQAIPPTVLTINLAGEPLTRTLADRILEGVPGVKLHDLYGPSEDTTYSTYVRRLPGAAASIGRPIQGTQLHLLDAHLNPVPVGVAGEIYLGGEGLARGYWGRPDQTAARFIPDPFGPGSGGRLYGTGDLGRYAEDGAVEFLGRADHQVKIRGHRIELGEIQTQLENHPDVAEAAVVAREDASGAKRIVAYVVPREGREWSVDNGRDYLARSLPEPMLPSACVVLAALPRTQNGKLDRKALPAPDSGTEPSTSCELLTQNEGIVAGLWDSVLGRAPVGRDDNFFDCGGHSLLATQLVSRLRTVFKYELPLRAIFECPTLGRLTAEVERGLRERAGIGFSPLPLGRMEGPPTLSFAQGRLWFFDQLQPNDAAYHIQSVYRLEGPLNMEAMDRSLVAVYRRHESLRTRFGVLEGKATAALCEPPGMVIRAGGVLGDDPSDTERFIRAESDRGFDLARDPLLRAAVASHGENVHILVLTMHHIVSDGWSMELLTRELTANYAAFAAGGDDPSVALAHSYSDFARWQRLSLQGERLDQQLKYWKNELSDLPVLLDLPTDRPRPPIPSFSGATESFALPKAVAKQLMELGRQEGATPFMVLLAAYQALLVRVTGQSDVAVGTPVANRQRSEAEPMIGLFVNTLVMRARLKGEPSFRRWLRQCRDQAIRAYTHQDLPLDLLVEHLGVERDLARNPLFQTVFTCQEEASRSRRAGGVAFLPMPVKPNRVRFDLECHLQVGAEGISGWLVFRTDLFDAATIRRLAGQFAVLVEAAARNPDSRVSELPLMGAPERARIVEEWNATASEYPRQSTVDAEFASQSRRYPHAIALSCDGGSLTYCELDERTNRMARWLRIAGVGRETPVVLFFERSLAMAEIQLAVLKAGGTYVPLDPGIPAERTRAIMAGLPSAIEVTEERLRAEAGAIAALSASPLDPVHSADDLAYIMYTSGSTGGPKAVGIPHRAILRLICNTNFARFVPGDTMLQLAPYSFDAATLEFWGALLTGGRLAIFPPQAPTVEALEEFIRNEHVTTLWLTAGLFHTVVAHGLGAFSGVSQLLAGGDVLQPDDCRRVLEAYPQLVLVNGYGPTESTTFACCEPMSGQFSGTSVPIGRPIANTQVYILDAAFNPCPPGVPGELYVGGDGLARGYVGSPDLTAEKFLPNPFSRHLGARLYRTGDRAKYGGDGRIDFLGRLDWQVKIRGYRIEPGEVEAALLAFHEVADAVVMARSEASGSKRLVAYVVGRSGPVDPAGLRQSLAAVLPDYLVPAVIVPLGRMPLTDNGKIDRRALPEPEWDAQTTGEEPRPGVETALAGLWRDLLRVPKVGRSDNFFSLGGDSILSIQIVARARALGWSLSPAQVFQHQTIAALAMVAQPVGKGSGPQTAHVGPVPLLPAQSWWLEGDPRDWHHFNQAVLLRMKRPMGLENVQRILDGIASQHDALRSRLSVTDSGWKSEIGPVGTPVPLRFVDLAGADDARARITAACAEEQTRLDPAAGVLWRAVYFDLGPGVPGRLFVAIHHWAVDGISWRILLDDLENAAAQVAAGSGIEFAPRTASLRQWGEGLTAMAKRGLSADERRYWLKAAAATLPLPRDLNAEGSANVEGCASVVKVGLTFGETETLRRIPEVTGISLEAALLASAAEALFAWTGGRELAVTMEGHGREELPETLDLSRTVGWFTGIYPLRLEHTPGIAPMEAARAVHELLRAVPRRGIGYGVARYMGDAEGLRKTAEPEVSFNYLGRFDTSASPSSFFELAGEGTGPAVSPRGLRRHLLEINGNIAEGELRFAWSFCDALHRRETIERLAHDFIGHLRLLSASVDRVETAPLPPSDLDEALGEVGFNE